MKTYYSTGNPTQVICGDLNGNVYNITASVCYTTENNTTL